MDNMINNLINGNIQDAKKSARNRKLTAIYQYLIDAGYTDKQAMITASFLKGETDFQNYCDNGIK